MKLTAQQFNQIVDLLTPRMGNENAREALIRAALFGCPVLDSIDWTDDARTFTVKLVQRLIDYGNCEGDKPAIASLLEAVKETVGNNYQPAFDDAIAIVLSAQTGQETCIPQPTPANPVTQITPPAQPTPTNDASTQTNADNPVKEHRERNSYYLNILMAAIAVITVIPILWAGWQYCCVAGVATTSTLERTEQPVTAEPDATLSETTSQVIAPGVSDTPTEANTVTDTPAPTTAPDIPEASNNQAWSNNRVIRYLYLPDSNVPVQVALVPQPRSGHYDMANDERVSVEMPYWIDMTEVTRGQLRECQLQGHCRNDANDVLEYNIALSDDHPITYINLHDSREICAWRGGRIPTEAEWEYAARGPDGWEYPNNVLDTREIVWRGNSRFYTETDDNGDILATAPQEVASVNDISWVGAYDMLGNVMEWTETEATQSEGHYILKGVAFSFLGEQNLRYSRLQWNLPTARLSDIGFRCVFEYDTNVVQIGLTEEHAVTNNKYWQPIIGIPDNTGTEMVLVPTGCFLMGDETENDEQSIQEECFNVPFWIDRYEVTREQYDECANTAPEQCHLLRAEDTQGTSVRDNQPINNVNWFQARDFCEWRNARLPTEVEWEYAARGPSGWKYPWGNEFKSNYIVWSSSTTANVGSIPNASWVGAYDMVGNVYEWTHTRYSDFLFPLPYATNDGREVNNELGDGQAIQRVFRGGSFRSIQIELSATYRTYFTSHRTDNRFGIRCVMDWNG